MDVADHKFRFYVGGHAGGEVRAAVGIERDNENAALDAAVKGGDPLCAVLSPQNHAIGGTDLFPGEQCGETAGLPGNITIGGNAPPVALVANYGDLAAVTPKVLNKCGQVVSHQMSGRFMVPCNPQSGAKAKTRPTRSHPHLRRKTVEVRLQQIRRGR